MEQRDDFEYCLDINCDVETGEKERNALAEAAKIFKDVVGIKLEDKSRRVTILPARGDNMYEVEVRGKIGATRFKPTSEQRSGEGELNFIQDAVTNCYRIVIGNNIYSILNREGKN
jgi:hypothetical protein